MKSDEEIIACYGVSGQHELLEELVNRYLGKVRAIIYPMVLDGGLADDLTQEVFLRALGGLGGFNGRARFSTWLYRVTMNTVYGFLARQRRSPVTFCSEVPEGVEPPGKVPDCVAMQAELESAIEAALQELPPKLRAAIVLTTLEKVEVGEAAHIEGCSRATMYWRIHEARKRLRQRLEGHLSGGVTRGDPCRGPQLTDTHE